MPVDLTNKIFIELLSKFKDLSDEIYEEIAEYFTKVKENVKCENLINIIKSINNKKCIKLILFKIIKFMIIDKKIFFNDKRRDELKVFIELQKIGIFKDKDYEFSPYVTIMISASKKIWNDIKNNNISYRELKNIVSRKIDIELKERFESLNVENTIKDEEINEQVENILNKKEKIQKQIVLLEGYHFIDNTFFNVSKHKEILELENLLDKSKNGNLDEIDRNKEKFDDFSKMYPNEYIEDKILLSTSIFFTSIFTNLKKKNRNI